MRMLSLFRVVLPLVIASRCHAQPRDQAILDDPDTACHNAVLPCLKSSLPTQTYYALTPDSVPAPDLVISFFAIQQREIIPACWLTPLSAQDVSTAINILKEYGCHFAVKSGGHGASMGMSSSEGGVAIDMRIFDAIEILEAGKEGERARVGTGGWWGEVYKKLEPYGKTVTGGRDPRVGVGGFLLGGGISFISRRYGWALDNVFNYEVILANGSISQISQATAPDLYWALRGGGNNFGIVTHFDLATYPLTQAWGGYNFYLLSDILSRLSSLSIPPTPFTFTTSSLVQQVGNFLNWGACKLGYCTTITDWLNAYLSILEKEQYDIDTQVIAGITYSSDLDIYIACANPIHAKAVPNPRAFAAFKKLPHVYSSNRIANYSTFHKELHDWNADGYRQFWATLTIKPNSTLMQNLISIFIQESQSLKQVKNVLPSFVFQAITADEILHMSRNGGNSLGLSASDAPILIYSFTILYSKIEGGGGGEDRVVQEGGRRIVERSERVAKEMGLWHPFIYLNYADISQDVFSSYGTENHRKLKEVQKKWDPEGVFGKRLQPGGFKV